MIINVKIILKKDWKIMGEFVWMMIKMIKVRQFFRAMKIYHAMWLAEISNRYSFQFDRMIRKIL